MLGMITKTSLSEDHGHQMSLQIKEQKRSIKEIDSQIDLLIDQLEKQNPHAESTQRNEYPSKNNVH
jgi:uncharacterized coiled-coil protein SlyX